MCAGVSPAVARVQGQTRHVRPVPSLPPVRRKQRGVIDLKGTLERCIKIRYYGLACCGVSSAGADTELCSLDVVSAEQVYKSSVHERHIKAAQSRHTAIWVSDGQSQRWLVEQQPLFVFIEIIKSVLSRVAGGTRKCVTYVRSVHPFHAQLS